MFCVFICFDHVILDYIILWLVLVKNLDVGISCMVSYNASSVRYGD